MMYFSKEELKALIGSLNVAWLEGMIGDGEYQQLQSKLNHQLEEME